MQADGKFPHAESVVDDLATPITTQSRLQVDQPRLQIPQVVHYVAQRQSKHRTPELSLKVTDRRLVFMQLSLNPILLRFRFRFWFCAKVRSHTRKTRHTDTCLVETFLHLFKFMVFELELTDKITHPEVYHTKFEK